MMFCNILKSFGFKPVKSWHPEIWSYELGQSPANCRYAEIQKYGTGKDYWMECWLIGKDIRNSGTISYPGGTRFLNETELKKYLQSLPKLN